MKLIIPETIAAITPYPPGKPQDELEREYGIKNSIKLASNENAWGPSPKVLQVLQDSLAGLNRYPDGSSYYLVHGIADFHGINAEEIVLGNGSNEVIEFLVKAFVREGNEVITSHPSFLMYQKFVQVRGGINKVLPLKEYQHDLEAIINSTNEATRLIFIDNPNNPTGSVIAPDQLQAFLERIPEHVVVVLDEAYIDFAKPSMHMDILSMIRKIENRCPVVLLRTFSKAYGLPGLRVGYGIMPREIATCLHKVRQPFNINNLAQVGALTALRDRPYFDLIVDRNATGRQYLHEAVEQLGCTPLPSETNFILMDVGGDADALYTAMLYKGVIIRSMRAYGYPNSVRVTVGTDEENARFIVALGQCLRDLRYV